VLLAGGLAATAAQALDVELNDVAPDRVERQRAFVRGELPLKGTPQVGQIDERLKDRGLARGRAIYIRIFKAESELELWMQNQSGTFTLLATYPICHWTGTIGPKLREGDKQSPEGFYSVGYPQTRLVGRWRKAFNLGFPNLHDQLLKRTGSYILIHGGCSSVGCFAMTDPVQQEIYELAQAALTNGQERFHVHIFPFRMTKENLARHSTHEWAHTWADLKPAYDSFERTRIPPKVIVCGVRYQVFDGLPGETGGGERRLAVLRPASRDADTGDLSIVTDADGFWSPPGCAIEDQARRKAQHTLTAAGLVADGMSGEADQAEGQEIVTSASASTGAAGEPASTPQPPRRPSTVSRARRGARAGGSQAVGGEATGERRDRVPPVLGGS
jgi:murein L,D-transpeptidase YafK